MKPKLLPVLAALLGLGMTQAFSQTDITNLPGTITAAYSDSPGGEDITKVIDNQTTTKYLTFHTSAYIQFQAQQPYVITKYAITSGNDAPERDPKNWNLTASNDGSSWATIDNRNNEDFTSRGQRKEYAISNTTAYKYYRLQMNNHTGTILQLAEWELLTPASSSNILTKGGELTIQYYDAPDDKYGKYSLIDGTPVTKLITTHTPVWIQLQQSNPSVVTSYAITTGDEYSAYDPTGWSLQGSNNGTTWTTLDSKNGQTFSARNERKSFTLSNTTAFTYYRLNISNSSNRIDLAEWELYGTGGGGNITVTPPLTIKETWKDNAVLTRTFFDDDVAIYQNDAMTTAGTWINTYAGDVWRYTKKVYGDQSPLSSDKRLYVLMHQGDCCGGIASYYFSRYANYKNSFYIASNDWSAPIVGTDTFNLNGTTHEIGHMVESNTGAQGSPAYGAIWQDGPWNAIYQYDVYKGLGMTAIADDYYRSRQYDVHDEPRPNTHWFRDWFYPIYHGYGESAVLAKYFKLLSQYFPKAGYMYTRSMNWGEFVHFWSGAAGVNLKAQATLAFGWSAEWETQFNNARAEFPQVTYGNSLRVGDVEINQDLSVFSNGRSLFLTLPASDNAAQAEVAVYTTAGTIVSTSKNSVVNRVVELNVENLNNGVYLVKVNSVNGSYTEKVVLQK